MCIRDRPWSLRRLHRFHRTERLAEPGDYDSYFCQPQRCPLVPGRRRHRGQEQRRVRTARGEQQARRTEKGCLLYTSILEVIRRYIKICKPIHFDGNGYSDCLLYTSCGNASRCIGKYLFDYGLTSKTEITLDTLSGIRTVSYTHLKHRNGLLYDF